MATKQPLTVQAPLQDAMEILSRRYIMEDGPIGHCAANGKPYKTITDRGVKAEGESQGDGWAAPGIAACEWMERVCESVGASKRIYWRRRPTVEHFPSGWRVYSRLAWDD